MERYCSWSVSLDFMKATYLFKPAQTTGGCDSEFKKSFQLNDLYFATLPCNPPPLRQGIRLHNKQHGIFWCYHLTLICSQCIHSCLHIHMVCSLERIPVINGMEIFTGSKVTMGMGIVLRRIRIQTCMLLLLQLMGHLQMGMETNSSL